MKKSMSLLCACSLMCAFGVACNDTPQEIKQATGTIIGSFSNGFCSLLLQVDEEYPIGETIEAPTPPARWFYTSLPETETGIYRNMIQVQSVLPLENKRISFSYRDYNKKKDFELFELGPALMAGESRPDVPIYVITKYEILNN